MVTVDTPARMTCDAEGCDKQAGAKLVLMSNGGFAFRPSATDWQVRMPVNAPFGAFQTRCPEHRVTVESTTGVIQGVR